MDIWLWACPSVCLCQCVRSIKYLVRVLKFHKLIPQQKIVDSERKAPSELTGWDSSRRPCIHPSVHPCFHTFKHEYVWVHQADRNLISSRSSFGWGMLSALGFGPGLIRPLLSVAKDSSYRFIMGKSSDYSSSFIFDWLF